MASVEDTAAGGPTPTQRYKTGADVGMSPEAWEDTFGPHTLVRFFFFHQNYKISQVQRRRQMLIYLDSGAAAHKIKKNNKNKNGLNRPN